MRCFTEYTRGTVAGLGETWPTCYTDEEAARFEDDIMPALAEHWRWRGEATGQRTDGRTYPRRCRSRR